MAIFNNYFKLPEGTTLKKEAFVEIQFWVTKNWYNLDYHPAWWKVSLYSTKSG